MSKTTELKETSALQGPQGQKMVLNLSAGGVLAPGAGIRCRKTGVAEKCGLIWGSVNRGFEHPNFKDPTKQSIRWHGSFGYQRQDGVIGQATTVYLPGVVERQLRSLGCPIVRDGEVPPPDFSADFSVEIWAEPDPENNPRPSQLGYSYGVYNRGPSAQDVRHLAPPEVRDLLPKPEPQLLGYDPETGEVDGEAKREAAE